MTCKVSPKIDLASRLSKLLIAAMIATACGSVPDGSAPDAQTLNQLTEINAELTNTRQLSAASFTKLRTFAANYPNSNEIFKAYRSALIAREDWAELDRLLTERAAKLSREDKLTLAKVRVRQGKFAESSSILEQLDGSQDDLELHSLRAISFTGIGDDARAASELDGIWEKVVAAKRIDDINLRAQIYFRARQYTQSIETAGIALSAEPANVVANNLTSRSYSALGDKVRADQFRIATERAHGVTSEDESRKMTLVSLSTKLKSAWSDQRYADVIAIGEKMLPLTSGNERQAIEQFIAASKAKLGK